MAGIVLRMLPPDAFTGIPSTPPEDALNDATRKLYYILVDAKFVGTAELDRDQSVDDLRLPLLRCPETASLVRHLSSLELADYEGRNTLRLGSRSQVSHAYLTLAVSDRNDSRSAYLVEKTVPSEGYMAISITVNLAALFMLGVFEVHRGLSLQLVVPEHWPSSIQRHSTHGPLREQDPRGIAVATR
ncbi:hypothetical protein FOZ62_013026 [Perkinsus olseni]|uniref:Uncharacterized protein n=1 Tax=Perkinsus olseni TaxID=32597 RepID=A0A7J6TFI8_PEROL|nr:hypothetical protein FOZ62_013026 [Perkinsus olseni]